jgi:predicted membrane chloride channel (bestrophin family)
MQKGSRGEPVQDSVSKPITLGLVTALVVGVVAPLVIPHLAHPSMIYHITLHIASLTIAVFLSIVSVLAYRRSAGARMLFMTLGFMALATVEFLYLLDATAILSIFNFSTLGIELPHVILLVMLAMFGLGVLKVNK